MRSYSEIFHYLVISNPLMPLFIAIGIVGFLSACGSSSSSDNTNPQPGATTSISVEVVDIPQAFKSNGQWQTVYELVINNTGETTVTLQSLNIQSANETLQQINSSELVSYALENTITISPDGFTALFLWVESDTESKPLSLINRVSFINNSSENFEHSFTLELDQQSVTTLSPPIKNSNWKALAINNDSHHRRSFMMFDDQPKFSQRYAIDWVKIDGTGSWYTNNGLKNEDHYAYGESVYASTSGEVVKVVNGYPDNTPGELADESTPLAGNYVILKTATDDYILFAHLIADSFAVKEGDLIDSSQLIGLIGNSGNSSAPHLHFHLAKDIDLDSPSGLDSTGIPYHFDRFEVTAGTRELGIKTNEMPNEGAVVGFDPLH